MSKSFASIKKQLSAQHYFMNDIWLRDCLDYFLTENPDADEAEIRSFVIHQWLLSDLREINNERGCLPANIQQQKLVTLPGNYILQIDKAYDISLSKYKQLEKIRNISNLNIEVTLAEQIRPMESNGRRMMNLYLCDGVQDVTAIEYKPISTFDKIVAGYKVMIKGPVDCRRGVILLEEKNICMIGGEIENLLISNATENVLARALQLPENPDPDIYIVKSNDAPQDLSDDNIDIDFETVENIEKLNNTMKTLSASQSSKHVSNKNSITASKQEKDCIVIDDTDDEWMGMIDENNLQNVVAPPPVPIRNLEPSQNDYLSDLEFTDFEMEDITEYDCNPSDGITVLSKPQNVPKTSVNASKFSNDKSNMRPLNAINVHKIDVSNTTKSKVQPSIKSRENSQPSPFVQSSKTSGKHHMSKSTATNNKITNYMELSHPKKNQSITSNRKYDSICDVKKIIPTKQLIYKTIRASTKTLQKLMKKDMNWYLEGSVTDGIDDINVIFSTEVLEKLIGFNAYEFSQRKKMQKTDPKIRDELRQTLRNTESVLIRMDALLKLELRPNESEARIICITDLP